MTTPIDFPLESQEPDSHVRIAINQDRLLLCQVVQGEPQQIHLSPAQVREIFQQCQGKLLGKLTGTHLQMLSELDQVISFLREKEEVIEDLCQGGPDQIMKCIHDAREQDEIHEQELKVVLNLFHSMALVTNVLLKDRMDEDDPSPEDRFELSDTPPDM